MSQKQNDILRWGVRERNTDKSRISYPVELFPLTFKDAGVASKISGDPGVCVVRTDSNQIICHASEDYQLVPHNDILSIVEETFKVNNILFELYDIHTGGGKYNKMYANYILSEYTFEIEGDSFTPFIQVYNSYDKSLLFGSITGLYRKACWNGNLWGTRDMQLIRSKHVGNKIDLFNVFTSMDKWVEGLGIAKFNLQKLLHQQLSSTVIEDVINSIFATKRDRKLIVESDLISNSITEFGDNRYALFNAVTNYATHKLPLLTTNYDWSFEIQKKITSIFFMDELTNKGNFHGTNSSR